MSNTLYWVVKHGTMPTETDTQLECYLCESEIKAGQRVQFSRAYIEYASELVSHVKCSAKGTLLDNLSGNEWHRESPLPYWWGR